MRSAITYLIVAMLLASCAAIDLSKTRSGGQGWYIVKPSDTLYSIAWRYGLDSQQLADWNNIDLNTPTIYPGQRLRLIKPKNLAATTSSTQASISRDEREAKPEQVEPSTASLPMNSPDPGKWIWPTAGKPLNTFLATRLDRRGIDIAGKPGQPVVAVADGKVVYSGNGLADYGNLIIIKHSETYLSAYAYCQQRLVEEGMSVTAGQQVATMGEKADVAQLHFEIRRNGKPVDPLKYLPNQ
jgi:lipoprotein NlpD